MPALVWDSLQLPTSLCEAILSVWIDMMGVLLVRRAFKTVVFVIDQVDAFVRACKQTLLYNVLDALTSSQVQVRSAGCCQSLVESFLPCAQPVRAVDRNVVIDLQ